MWAARHRREAAPPNEKMLLVSWSVPPETAGSSVVVGSLARQFTAADRMIAGEKPVDAPPAFAATASGFALKA